MSIYIEQLPGRTISYKKHTYLYFGGTSYLGLNTDPDFRSLLMENLQKYGLSHGASRHSNVRLDIFDQAEGELAHRLGSQDAAMVSSGYLAGQLLRHSFNAEEYAVFHHVSAHSSIRLKGDRIYSGITDLNKDIRAVLNGQYPKIPVLFLDSISFNAENFPDFSWLKSLPLQSMILAVDDSHGVGIIGEGGGGVYKLLASFSPRELICCGSLNKALAIPAGAIWGFRKRMEEIKETPVFAGSSPPSPAGLATFLKAEQLYHKRLELLRERYYNFLQQLNDPAYFQFNPGHPAFSFQDVVLAENLEHDSILTTRFVYAGSSEPNLNRIVLSAHHTNEDIALLAKSINKFLRA